MTRLKNFWCALRRKKRFEESHLTETKLNRCLSLFELTTLGIGSTIGLGVHVIGGQVASTKAGPAVILSYFVAALTSLFAALCYAEFGARVPRAGSAYVYSYVAIGELMAFVIGWDLILEYVIAAASVARGYSGYVDSLVGGHILAFFDEYLPLHVRFLSNSADLFAFAIIMALTTMLAFGVQESTRFQAVFTILNLLVVVFIAGVGLHHGSMSNWQLHNFRSLNSSTHAANLTKTVPAHAGHGGFFPYGVSGMMSGAATCFYAFVGFDVIATMGEEVQNPRRNIPIATCISLLVVTLAYTVVAAAQTLLWPYWDQNRPAPLPYIFEQLNLPTEKWIVAIGALAGLSSTLIGGLFPLPRIMYAMAGDGLVFRFLARVHPRFGTPLLATFVAGLFAATMAALFDVHELADMMSVGTLNAYALVSLSVLILRYHEDFDKNGHTLQHALHESVDITTISNVANAMSPMSDNISLRNRTLSPPIATPEVIVRSRSSSLSKNIRQLDWSKIPRAVLNLDNVTTPTPLTVRLSKWLICITTVLIVALDVILITLIDHIVGGHVVIISAMAIIVASVFLLMVAIARQPTPATVLSFKVPLVPLVPFLSIFSNVYLALSLSMATWVRVIVWFFFGLTIYFGYGIRNSSEGIKADLKKKHFTNEPGATVEYMTVKGIPRLNIIEATPEANVKVY